MRQSSVVGTAIVDLGTVVATVEDGMPVSGLNWAMEGVGDSTLGSRFDSQANTARSRAIRGNQRMFQDHAPLRCCAHCVEWRLGGVTGLPASR
jgi:hypothetical protein